MTGLRVARVVVSAVAVAAAIGCVVVGLGRTTAPALVPESWTSADLAEDRHGEILTAARRTLTMVLDVDYREIDRQIDAVLERATGAFKEEYEQDRERLVALTRKGQTISKGVIREIGITRADEKEALLLVAADSQVENAATTGEKAGQVRPHVFAVTMAKVGDRWLVSGLEVVQ